MSNLRKCKVQNKYTGLFHRWSDKTEIIPPSPLMGGHNGGVLQYTVGIVELLDGRVVECTPTEIKFIKAYYSEDGIEEMER